MDEFENRPDVPLIDRVKIQAEVLVPLIKEPTSAISTTAASPTNWRHHPLRRPRAPERRAGARRPVIEAWSNAKPSSASEQ
jgi:hypothetical protein